jgi:hypothetical protein
MKHSPYRGALMARWQTRTPRRDRHAFDHAEIARRLAGPRNGVVAAMDFVEGRDAAAKGGGQSATAIMRVHPRVDFLCLAPTRHCPMGLGLPCGGQSHNPRAEAQESAAQFLRLFFAPSCSQTCLADCLGCPDGGDVCQVANLRQMLASQGCCPHMTMPLRPKTLNGKPTQDVKRPAPYFSASRARR